MVLIKAINSNPLWTMNGKEKKMPVKITILLLLVTLVCWYYVIWTYFGMVKEG